MQAFVIDDSKPVRSILVKMLQTMNFETVEAENGQQALDYLNSKHRPDVFVVNLNMPVLNGLDFIKVVQADKNYADVPIVVVSGETKKGMRAIVQNAGADVFLSKPVTLGKLGDTLVSLGLHDGLKGRVFSPASERSVPVVRPATEKNPFQQQGSTRLAVPPAALESTPGKIRVLIVDDSVVVRGIVSKMLQADGQIEVVATAADGVIALAKLKQFEVDVILLDIEMPRMTGLEVLKHLREVRNRTPVVMFSSLTRRGASETIEALMLGAKDYVMKPGGALMTDADEGKRAIMEELIPKVKQAALKTVPAQGKVLHPPLRRAASSTTQLKRIEAVVIGVSTGGPQTLATLIPKLGSDFPVPVIIVQHMPADFTKHLSDRLTMSCGFPVSEAVHGQHLEAGHYVVAPGGLHLSVKRLASKVVVALNDGPPVNACKPAADVLFESAANAYSGNVLGVVLTGMGADGTVGAEAINNAGGTVIVQDEESSVVWGMPGSVVRAGAAEKVVAIDNLAGEILKRAWKFRQRPMNLNSGTQEASGQ